MGYPIQRIPRPSAEDAERLAADRARLLERVAIGLAHDAKNPLHNMVLHLQLMSEKLAGGTAVDKHVSAMRDGIGRIDALLRCFGDFAAPRHLAPDLGAAVQRAFQLFVYEGRRAAVQLRNRAPANLLVQSDSAWLGDLVAHALVACIEHARDGGEVDAFLEPRGAVAVLELRSEGGIGNRDQALPHLDAARRLAPEAACELSIEIPAAGGARLSLSFLHPR